MHVFQYPRNDLDDSEKLLSVLGSFWSSSYQGNLLLQDLTKAAGQTAQQTYLNFLELIQSISRYDVPVFHKENWYALVVRESELQAATSEVAAYVTNASATCDGPTVEETADRYDSDTSLTYGGSRTLQRYAVRRPKSLADAKQLQNNVVNPTSILFREIDFRLTAEYVLLRNNVFEDTSWPKRDILNAKGEIVDRECVIWIYRGDWDWQVVYEQFGYALNLKMKSSQAYKDFVVAILDAFSLGTTVRTQQQAIAAAFGIPFVVEPVEIVENIISTAKDISIVTDKHVYKFPTRTNVTVAVGEKLHAGDMLTDNLQIFELNRGFQNQPISALTLDKGLLASGFFQGLTFENKTTPVNVELNVDGYTKVSWALGGFDFDVEEFWDRVHKAGIAKNKTIAHLLDVRPNPTGEPTAASLPKFINPLQFLIDNFLRNNAYVVKLRITHNTDKLKFFPVEQFRKAQPPHTVMILVVELVHCDPPVIMESAGTPTEAGYEENVTGFHCMLVSDTIEPATFIGERVRTGIIGGRCI